MFYFVLVSVDKKRVVNDAFGGVGVVRFRSEGGCGCCW